MKTSNVNVSAKGLGGYSNHFLRYIHLFKRQIYRDAEQFLSSDSLPMWLQWLGLNETKNQEPRIPARECKGQGL